MVRSVDENRNFSAAGEKHPTQPESSYPFFPHGNVQLLTPETKKLRMALFVGDCKGQGQR